MGTTAWLIAYGAVLAACVLALCVLGAVVLGNPTRRRTRERQVELDAELARSHAEVAALRRRVEELDREVGDARRATEMVDREYVITSLTRLGDHTGEERTGDQTGELDRSRPVPARVFPRPGVGEALEARLVHRLTQVQDGSPVKARAADLVVRSVAVAHGVRRALSPDVLDRAAAEAGVARRRSRRDRRRELREARRLVRTVRVPGDHAAGSAGRDPAARTGGRDEDAA